MKAHTCQRDTLNKLMMSTGVLTLKENLNYGKSC